MIIAACAIILSGTMPAAAAAPMAEKIEQNAKKALSIANRAYVLETGKIVLEGNAKDLMNDDSIKKAYLGE